MRCLLIAFFAPRHCLTGFDCSSTRNSYCWKFFCNLSLWLSGLTRFLSHSTCWAYLAGDLQRPGIKSGSRHELSVGWTNGRYAMRLVSWTDTEGPLVSSLNCDRCRLWSYDITAGYKCEYYIIFMIMIIIIIVIVCSFVIGSVAV